MYKKYWNLREAPFINSYNPRQLYLSSQFEEGVARLFYLVSEGRVAGVLTGQFGMGKSFLLSNPSASPRRAFRTSASTPSPRGTSRCCAMSSPAWA